MSFLLLIIAIIVFGLAYKIYAKRIFNLVELDDKNITPAITNMDGVDYVPAEKPVLFGHHFSSIAGAAPIIGPIAAAAYGWLPVFLWILVGAVFMGCVHDFGTLIMSVRHEGQSIGNIIEIYLGKFGKFLFLIFGWLTLILVVAVFMVVVAKTFISNPATLTASILYLILAVAFGLLHTKCKIPVISLTAIFLPLLGLSIWLGIKYPLAIPAQGIMIPLTAITLTPLLFCIIILMLYIFVASTTPVWILLQPRDFLSSFLLYSMIGLAFVGICITQPEIKLPAFQAYSPKGLGNMFPMLFVVVACGAISGFHAVVASGTTSKQLKKESDAKAVGYGAMLVEGILAVMAVIMVLKLNTSQYAEQSSNPILLFSRGFGSLMPSLHISADLGKTFATLAVSAFALTSLDTATRLSRLFLQDIFAKKHPKRKRGKSYLDRYSATIICTILAGLLALSGQWKTVWPLFGAANQLVAAIALLTITLWLLNLKKNIWYTFIPMCFMFLVTLCALASMLYNSYQKIVTILQTETTQGLTQVIIVSLITFALFAVGVSLLVLAINKFRELRRPKTDLLGRQIF